MYVHTRELESSPGFDGNVLLLYYVVARLSADGSTWPYADEQQFLEAGKDWRPQNVGDIVWVYYGALQSENNSKNQS